MGTTRLMKTPVLVTQMYVVEDEMTDSPKVYADRLRAADAAASTTGNNISDFVDTLVNYVESGFCWQEVSRKMKLHRNTIKYRLDRMQDIAGLFLMDNPQLVLKLYFELTKDKYVTASNNGATFKFSGVK